MFSVSATKKVQFTGGNLQATIDASGAPTKWKFAANQYEYLGESGANTIIGSAVGEIALFKWSTKATDNNWGISSGSIFSEKDKGDFKDWGNNFNNICRTLSETEGNYLLKERTVNGGKGAGKSYKYATISIDASGVKGLILYPDDYTSQTEAETYSLSEWSALEDAGCVFIPAAGYRYQNGVKSIQVLGYVWTSTPDTAIGSVNRVSVNSSGVSVGSCSIDYGCSVRLVTDVD